MKQNKIEIRLSDVNAQEVHLDSMSAQALESFLVVSDALKNIAQSISSDLTFSIEKGSVRFGVMSSTETMNAIYRSMELAIEGESEDEIITSNLRKIQQEMLQQDVYSYQFLYGSANIGTRLQEAKKISKKRVKKHYENELDVVSGYFNSIGGNDPNYHFDYGGGKKVTVDCTMDDAYILKDYLYSNITCLVKKKVATEDVDNKTYTHCSVLEKNQVNHLKTFINDLNDTEDLLNRLDLIYDFIDDSQNRIKDLKVILKNYSLFFSDVNEFKTLLIISEGFIHDLEIQQYRDMIDVRMQSLLTKV